MERANREFLQCPGMNISILETSHRSKEFKNILKTTEQLLREEMNIPNEFEVLFMHGGASGQFSAVPLNLADSSKTADYMVTGSWSGKSFKESLKYINSQQIFSPSKPYVTIPDECTWKRNENAAYLSYCANETIEGIEFQKNPETLSGVPLIADVSSNILSRPFNFTDHGVVYAGAQKNLGPAGITVVMVRRDLIGKERKETPSILNYSEISKNNSVYNTPCVFAVYMTKLVLEWLRDQGGVNSIFEMNKQKAKLIYDVIESSNGFYTCPVDVRYRSLMNIPFRISKGNDLEKQFISESINLGMIGIEGHRSVGGMRASLYNAITSSEVTQFANFMNEFYERHIL